MITVSFTGDFGGVSVTREPLIEELLEAQAASDNVQLDHDMMHAAAATIRALRKEIERLEAELREEIERIDYDDSRYGYGD